MRERHRLKFNDSTSKLRTQCKALAKRVVVLETQLSKNSVSKLLYVCMYVCVYYICTIIFVRCKFRGWPKCHPKFKFHE